MLPRRIEKQVLRCAQHDNSRCEENSRNDQRSGTDKSKSNYAIMDYKTIQLAFDAGIATITLNRPDKRNAISFELIDDLRRALDEVERSPARVLILTGRIFTADEAYRMGLINEIMPPEKLIDRARELAARLMENSPTSLRLTKRLLSDHARAELDAQIETAVRESAAIRATADFREGISSFLEKRKPRWSPQ